MRNSTCQNGFSLIELLLVVVIIGMLAAVAVPSLISSKDAAERAAIVGTFRTIHTTQELYKSSRGRYARLAELTAFHGSKFGTTAGTTIRRENWTILMLPAPTDLSLRRTYTIYAMRQRGTRISLTMMTENGQVQTVIP